MDYGEPASYLTLAPGTDVVASDGQVLGKVEHVLAAEDEDIFDGLVVDLRAGPGGHRFVDSEQVDEIYERGVVLKLDRAAAEELPKPTPNPGVIHFHADETKAERRRRRLHRAWDLISGNY